MSDRELLELAAKAAGVSVWTDIDGDYYSEGFGVVERPWNPITDDGDALRLAVNLRLSVSVDQWEVSVWKTGSGHDELVETATMGYPIEEAVRRCIVRVAAALGKATP